MKKHSLFETPLWNFSISVDNRQLEKEISRNGWMTAAVNSHFIFDENNSRKWEKAYNIIGVNPYSISNKSGNA